MKKYFCIIIITVLSACSHEKSDIKIENVEKENYNNRYQITTSPVMVIDKITGQVWKATGNEQNGYAFERICYRSKDGSNLMPTPYEDTIVSDLSSYQKECNKN